MKLLFVSFVSNRLAHAHVYRLVALVVDNDVFPFRSVKFINSCDMSANEVEFNYKMNDKSSENFLAARRTT